MKRILILGKQNPIASSIYNLLTSETKWQVDLEFDNYEQKQATDTVLFPILYDKKEIKRVVAEFQPNYIINCLTFDDIDFVEINKKYAWDYKYGITESLIRAASMYESNIINFSSEYIYNGMSGPFNEEHLPEPINYYGKIKLGCENQLIGSNIGFVTFRIPEYYGGVSLLNSNIYYKILNDKKVWLATNSFTTPIYIEDVSVAVLKALYKNKHGFYNLAGNDYVSEYEYGLRIAKYLEKDTKLIEPYTYSLTAHKNSANKYLRGGLVNLKAQTDLNCKFVNLHSGLSSIKYQNNIT